MGRGLRLRRRRDMAYSNGEDSRLALFLRAHDTRLQHCQPAFPYANTADIRTGVDIERARESHAILLREIQGSCFRFDGLCDGYVLRIWHPYCNGHRCWLH